MKTPKGQPPSDTAAPPKAATAAESKSSKKKKKAPAVVAQESSIQHTGSSRKDLQDPGVSTKPTSSALHAASDAECTASKKKKKNKSKLKGNNAEVATDGAAFALPEKLKGNEIDDIFGDAMDKIAKQIKETKASKATEKRAAPATEDDEFFDSRGLLNKKRKKVDGVYVYYLDELGVGQGGGTPDCPFDCKCCY
jgi:hypothetical protein